jgi:hypothetical protein
MKCIHNGIDLPVKECKVCEYNRTCILEERLEHIHIIHEVKRIIIENPEILDENIYTKY